MQMSATVTLVASSSMNLWCARMVNSLDLTTLVTQIPEAQRVHHALLTHPEIQQRLAQELVLKRQQTEKNQVAKSKPTEHDTGVDRDAHQQQKQGFARDGHPPSDSSEPELPDTAPKQGHIIDVQV